MTSKFFINELKKLGIEAETTTLGNARIRGVQIGGEDSPLFYPEDLLQAKSEDQLPDLIKAIKSLLPDMPEPEQEKQTKEVDLFSWAYAKEHIYLCPQAKDTYLTNGCKQQFLDMDIYMRVDIGEPTKGSHLSHLVIPDHLSKRGITQEDAFAAAVKNSRDDFVIEDSLAEFEQRALTLRKMGVLRSEIDTLRKHEEHNRTLTVTAKSGYSPAVIVFDNVLREVANTLQSDWAQDYMLGFTDNDTVLIKPIDEYENISDLVEFNRSFTPNAILPAHPYYYNAEANRLFDNLNDYIKCLDGLEELKEDSDKEYEED